MYRIVAGIQLGLVSILGLDEVYYKYQNKSIRVDSLVMRQLKIDRFEMIAFKLQAVSHNTTCLIIPTSTLYTLDYY